MPNIDNIVKQLKNRKVFRSIAIYAGFAFVLLQVCDIVIPRLFLPEWTMTFIIVLTIIGFPIIAILSWIYDITPAEDGETPPTEATQPLGVYALTGLVLTVIGIGFWISVGVFGVTFGGDDEVPSIGILMMENLGAEDEEFWSSGMTADLITKVKGAGLIRVASLDDILNLDKDLSIEEKAKKLRVKYILTHTFKIIDDGFELWSTLENTDNGISLFSNKISEPLEMTAKLVGRLANDIITSLDVKTKQEVMKAPTANIEAYEYYLKAKHKYDKRESEEDIELVKGLLKKSIELDDNLLSAKQLLGWVFYHTGNVDKAKLIFQNNLKQAEKLDDKRSVAEYFGSLATYYADRSDYDIALEYVEKSIESR